jgi:hypothetical protein
MMGAAIHGGPPQFTGIAMSNLTFTAGSVSPVGTATASVSSGTTTPTWSLKLSGTDSSGTSCVDNSSHFAINSTTGVVTPNINDAAQSYPGTCVQADQAGLTNTPFSKAFQFVGSAAGALAVAVNPASATVPCNAVPGLTISNVSVTGGNGAPVTLSLTAGGTDFALDSFAPPANVVIGSSGITTSGFACASLPGGGANETVTVTATQTAPPAAPAAGLAGQSSACSTVPPAAAAAGLATSALCNDWTAGLPSSAGTGLTLPAGAAANTDCVGGAGCWYMQASATQCGPGDAFPHVWYAPDTGQCSQVQESEPTGGGVHLLKDTDPTYGSGQYAEDFSASLATQQKGGAGLRLSTKNCCNVASTSSNLFSDYPMASYTEIVARSNDEDAFCASPGSCGQPSLNFFTWAADNWDASACALELVTIELWGKLNFAPDGGGGSNWCQSGTTAAVWSGYGIIQSKLGLNFTTKAYHKYGQLVTSNGTTLESCSYIDDVLMGCNGPVPPTPYAAIGAHPDNTGSVAQRRDLDLWFSVNFSSTGAQNQCPASTGTVGTWAGWCVQFPTASPGFSTSVGQLGAGLHVLVKSIQVRSCADWPRGSAGPNPSCFGQTTLTTDTHGSYYKVVTQ